MNVLSVAVTRWFLNINVKEERDIWILVSACCHLAAMFLGWTSHKEHVVKQTHHLMVARNQKKEKEGCGKNVLSKEHPPPNSLTSSTEVSFPTFHVPPICIILWINTYINIHEVKTSWFGSPTYMTAWETKHSTYEVFGIFQIQTTLCRLEGLIDNLCTCSSKSIEKDTRSSLDMSPPKKIMPLLANSVRSYSNYILQNKANKA